jgi:hypothetical protein
LHSQQSNGFYSAVVNLNFLNFVLCVCAGQKSNGKGYEITYRVKEHRRVVGHIGTMIGNNDGSLVSD